MGWKPTVLRLCRCKDCPIWSDEAGCPSAGFSPWRPNGNRREFRHLYSTLGMMKPTDWHYCGRYPRKSEETIIIRRNADQVEAEK